MSGQSFFYPAYADTEKVKWRFLCIVDILKVELIMGQIPIQRM